MADVPRLIVRTLSAGERPDLVRGLQALRYTVAVGEPGQLVPPTLDHASRLDVDPLDADSAFAIVLDRDAVVGGLRLRRRRPFWVEREFALSGPAWRSGRFVEGTRFIVRSDVRGGPVALLLRDAASAWATRHGLDRLISLVLVSDPAHDAAVGRGLYDWLSALVMVDTTRAAVAPPCEALDLDDPAITPRPVRDPARLPPMMRMLANRRTMLAGPPAWDPAYHAWAFLLVSRLGPSAA